MLFLVNLFPRTGPVVKDFLDKVADAAIGGRFGSEIKSLGETRNCFGGSGLARLLEPCAEEKIAAERL
jgi:hypothetical protein